MIIHLQVILIRRDINELMNPAIYWVLLTYGAQYN